MTRLDRLARDRAERPALQSYGRAKLRPVFDRLGWDGNGSGDNDDALLRSSLISALGEFGDGDILAEAKTAVRRLPAGSAIAAERAARSGHPSRRHRRRSRKL